MERKLWPIALAGVFLVGWAGTQLHSQQNESPELQPQMNIAETEEAVLMERAQALKVLYDRQLKRQEVGAGHGFKPVYVLYTGRDWHLAEGELAAVRGKLDEQIRHLEKAVEMAEDTLKMQQHMLETGREEADQVTNAIVRRADVKLALIRAKKEQLRRK